MSKKKPVQFPGRYFGRAWRAAYGLTLTRDEVRLVQGLRGVSAEMQAHLLAFASFLVVDGDAIIAAKRVLRTAGDDPTEHHDYEWKCDAPAIVNGGAR